jgi:hypothetical protein
MGGVWERQIRTIRSVLHNLLSRTAVKLNSDELRTLFYEAMAIVNSRPLTVENLYDHGSPRPITPNHLLTMKTDVIFPTPGEFSSVDLYSRKRWRKIQTLANDFWCRWRKEYLSNLQTRSKWNSSESNLKVGAVVLVSDENASRNLWKLGRVVEVFPGSDGNVRKVKVLIGDCSLANNGKRVSLPQYLERPIHKLVLVLE